MASATNQVESTPNSSVISLQDNDHQLQSTLNVLPLDTLVHCLCYLNYPNWAQLSLTSRECYQLASNDKLWKLAAERLGLTHLVPSPKKACHFGYVMYSGPGHLKKLGNEICQTIEKMNVWEDKLLFDGPYPDFPESLFKDGKSHFLKTIVDGDLVLILFPKNRFNSEVIKFNHHFNLWG